MQTRPTLHNKINCSSTCSCGNDKPTSRQWCDDCWDLLSLKASRIFQQRSLALARSILACEKLIAEAKEAQAQT